MGAGRRIRWGGGGRVGLWVMRIVVLMVCCCAVMSCDLIMP